MEAPPLDRYLNEIRAAYPRLQFDRARLDLDGLVNDVVILDEAWVFRFPKDDWAREVLQHEARVLALARRRVSLPLPELELHPSFAAYRMIPGRALFREDIFSRSEPEQEALAEVLGTFLRELHSISAAEAAQYEIGPSGAARTLDHWRELYTRVEQELFPLLMAHQRQWVRRRFAPVLEGELSLEHTPVLVHGDLGQYHLLYDPQANRLNGVIDFGTAGLGDPAVDLAAVIDAFGERFLERMLPYYPGILPALDRARFWASTLELQWALGGLRSGDLSWFAVHLGRARDTLPYGTRL